ELDRALQRLDRLGEPFRRVLEHARARLLHEAPRVEAARRSMPDAGDLGAKLLRRERGDDRFGDLALDREQVFALAIVRLRPDLRAVARVVQLRDDAEVRAAA